MAKVSVKIPNLKAKAERLQVETERALAREIEFARGEIDARTAAGNDVNGIPFEPYSGDYYDYRTARGYSGKVNLTITGTLLRSMTSRIEATKDGIAGIIFFLAGRPDGKTNAEIARIHQTGDYGSAQRKVRKFFALSSRQVREIVSNIKKGLKL